MVVLLDGLTIITCNVHCTSFRTEPFFPQGAGSGFELLNYRDRRVERQRRWPVALFRRLATLPLSNFFPLNTKVYIRDAKWFIRMPLYPFYLYILTLPEGSRDIVCGSAQAIGPSQLGGVRRVLLDRQRGLVKLTVAIQKKLWWIFV